MTDSYQDLTQLGHPSRIPATPADATSGGKSARNCRLRSAPAKLPSTATGYSDSSLKKGEGYAYRVRAINDDGESACSNVARVTLPTKP